MPFQYHKKIYENLKSRQMKTFLSFISTFNRNNPNIYSTIKSSVNCLKNNNLSCFHNIKLIQSNCQSLNLKKLLAKAEFEEVLSGTFNCSDKTCEYCNFPFINDHYTFKNVQITFKLKNRFICNNSFNLIYVVICDISKEEYIRDTGEGKTKLKGKVRVYCQHIRQPQ